MRYFAHQLILGQNVKGHRVTKCKNILKTIEPKWLKLLKLPTCRGHNPSRVLTDYLILAQKVKGEGHRVTKWKNVLTAIEWQT